MLKTLVITPNEKTFEFGSLLAVASWGSLAWAFGCEFAYSGFTVSSRNWDLRRGLRGIRSIRAKCSAEEVKVDPMSESPQCPECSSIRLYKDGLRYLPRGASVQRWLCRDCGFHNAKRNILSFLLPLTIPGHWDLNPCPSGDVTRSSTFFLFVCMCLLSLGGIGFSGECAVLHFSDN